MTVTSQWVSEQCLKLHITTHFRQTVFPHNELHADTDNQGSMQKAQTGQTKWSQLRISKNCTKRKPKLTGPRIVEYP